MIIRSMHLRILPNNTNNLLRYPVNNHYNYSYLCKYNLGLFSQHHIVIIWFNYRLVEVLFIAITLPVQPPLPMMMLYACTRPLVAHRHPVPATTITGHAREAITQSFNNRLTWTNIYLFTLWISTSNWLLYHPDSSYSLSHNAVVVVVVMVVIGIGQARTVDWTRLASEQASTPTAIILISDQRQHQRKFIRFHHNKSVGYNTIYSHLCRLIARSISVISWKLRHFPE